MMAGNILGKGYTAGVGMTIGTAFGRIAGSGRRRRLRRKERMQRLEALIAEASGAVSPPGSMLDASEAEVARQLQICNACRYCEGFCAVFPAMTRRLEFAKADIHYLANLCHNCGACLHACQYAPPHEFAVSVPRGDGAGARPDLRRLRLAAGLRRALRAQRADRRPGAGGEPGRLSRPRRRRAPGSSSAGRWPATSTPCSRTTCWRRPSASSSSSPAGARHRRDAASAATSPPAGRTAPALGEATASVLAPALPRRRPRPRLQRRGRRLHAAPAPLPPLHLLRLPALLRRDLRRHALPLPARRRAPYPLAQPAGGAGHARRHRPAGRAGRALLWLHRRRDPCPSRGSQNAMDRGFIALLFLTSATGLACSPGATAAPWRSGWRSISAW